MPTTQTTGSMNKAAWIEPEVLSLNVVDTATLPRRGTDTGPHLDCTRS